MEVTNASNIFLMIFCSGLCVLLLVIVKTEYSLKGKTIKEQAIIERFGKYQKVANSGIHIRLPFWD